MSQFFISQGQSLKGPVTGRKRSTRADGKIQVAGAPSIFYHAKDYNTTPLPESLVEFLSEKIESNGKSALQNGLDTGLLVTESGAMTPVVYAPPAGGELTAFGPGQITKDA